MHLFWIVAIGVVAGVIATMLTPGGGLRAGALAVTLGIGGALAATCFGHLVGLFAPDRSASFIGAVIGATTLLLAHHFAAKK